MLVREYCHALGWVTMRSALYTPTMRRLDAELGDLPAAGAFSEAELEGLPEPAKRYLRAVIAPGTPLATSAHLHMRGSIKLGLWLPFRARQVLAPHRGFAWAARVAGVISGSDQYVGAEGGWSGNSSA